MEKLNELNEKGRAKITEVREELENLYLYGKETGDTKYDTELESQRHLLAWSVTKTYFVNPIKIYISSYISYN